MTSSRTWRIIKYDELQGMKLKSHEKLVNMTNHGTRRTTDYDEL